MLTAERRQIISEKLQTEKKVIVSHLSDLFSVSDETIRRDLEYLCKAGLAIKSYGGAILNENDLPFSVRKAQNAEQKKKIATFIKSLVNDGESIMLDASTTAVFVANALKEKSKLKVITNSIEVMLELSDKSDWTIIATGGYLMGDYLAFAGQRAVSEIASFHIDKLIFSCKGLTQEGIFESNDDFCQVKRAMLKAAKTKILAVDFSKFNKRAFSKIANITDIDMVVTDIRPSNEWVDWLKAYEIGLMIDDFDIRVQHHVKSEVW